MIIISPILYRAFQKSGDCIPLIFTRYRGTGNNCQHPVKIKKRHKENTMAVFKCEKCGATKEGRCKPKKCPECSEAGTMQKQEEKKSSGCGCTCSAKK